MPSLHAGFAFAIGIALIAALRPRWAKVLAGLWGPAVVLSVVATGNHFIFDVAVGLLVTAAGYQLGRLPSLLAARSAQPASHIRTTARIPVGRVPRPCG